MPLDINECTDRNKNNCSLAEYCINEPGSFRCVCAPGYTYARQGCKRGKIRIKEYI